MAGPLANWFTKTYKDIIKANPAQRSIASQEPTSSPVNNIVWATAYNELEIVHRCVEIMINASVSIPFRVDQTAGRGPVQKIDNLLNNRTNPFEDNTRLFRRAYLDFIIEGNTFFYYDDTWLYVLPAGDVEIIADENKFVRKYVYTPTSQNVSTNRDGRVIFFNSPTTQTRSTTSGTESVEFKPEEIIHIRDDSDTSIYRGKSKLQSLTNLITIYDALLDFQKQFFQNNAVPGIILTTDAVLNPKTKDRVLEEWSNKYTTIFSGVRRPAILDGGLQIDSLSDINFQQLDFENSVERIQQDIAKSLGVPYVLLKSGNSANLKPNQVVFYEHTIVPMVELFASAFQQKWRDLEITPDVSNVVALQPELRTQVQLITSLVNSGVITPNEGRSRINLEKSKEPEMDKIRVPQNITGSATNPDIGGRPPNDEVDDIPEDSTDGE